MSLYDVTVKVDQIVTKEVNLTVEANSEEEAESFSRQALDTYPKPVACPNVKTIVTTKSTYWIPKSLDFMSIKQVKNAK